MDAITALGLGAAGKIAYDIAGPFVRELGEMLKDQLRPYRASNEVKIIEKTARMVEDAKLQVRIVSPKLLVPILEYGSLEDDDNLQTMWSALLANAATQEDVVSPIFVDILRQLSPLDARVFNSLFDYAMTSRSSPTDLLGSERELLRLFKEQYEKTRFVNSCQNLLHLSLISIGHETAVEQLEEGGALVGEIQKLAITPFGLRFLKACDPPPWS